MAQTAKAAATANRIAGVAADLFFANGFDATTIAQVATAADVASGTVLLHFGSKSELATAAFANEIRALVERAAENLPGTSAQADLRAFIGTLYAWYAEHERVAPALLRQALFSSGPWAIHYQATVAETVRVLSSAVANHHKITDGEQELLGQGLLADYLLVLLQGLAGTFDSVTDQVDHFLRLAHTRLRHYPDI